jgi:hypothetical protein
MMTSPKISEKCGPKCAGDAWVEFSTSSRRFFATEPDDCCSIRIRNVGSKANFGLWRHAEGGLWQYRGIVSLFVDTGCSGYLELFCFALLSGTEPAQIFPTREEIFKPPIAES